MSAGPNWGRWGKEDERGTANLLTPQYLRGLLGQSFDGRVFSLGLEISHRSPSYGRAAPLHLMSVDGADFSVRPQASGFGFADDYLVMACHSSTHIDGLAHVISDGNLYNGFSSTEVRSSGAARCGVDKVGGLVTRAHVIDMAAEVGVAELPEDHVIHAADLDAACSRLRIEPSPGDAALIRTGFIERLRRDPGRVAAEPGLDADCTEWMRALDLSLVGADNSAVEHLDGGRQDMPLHRGVVVGLGAYLLELVNLEEVVAAGVTRGLLLVAPLRISRGVGSPVNPILVT